MILGRDCDSVIHSMKYWIYDLNVELSKYTSGNFNSLIQMDNNFIRADELELWPEFLKVNMIHLTD
jgi:hypothetical protein